MKIAIFGNIYQSSKSVSAGRFFDVISRHGAELYIDAEFMDFLQAQHVLPEGVHRISGNDFEADIAVSIGGDGTFLKTAERVNGRNIPIVGINAGRLGFLADISEDELDGLAEELFSGNYRTETRSMLEVVEAPLPEDYWPYSLNEVAVLKQESSSMITINTRLGEEFLNSYQADGLIISTPTGSTGYSLSVGGPVLMPQTSNFVISPVAPHSLNVRPLVVSDNDEIELTVKSRTGKYLLSLDGRSAVMPCNTAIKLRKAPFTTILLKRHTHNFLDTLRNKLMWGADKRN